MSGDCGFSIKGDRVAVDAAILGERAPELVFDPRIVRLFGDCGATGRERRNRVDVLKLEACDANRQAWVVRRAG